MTEPVFCVLCGREGHRSSNCPMQVPPESVESDRRLNLKWDRAHLTQAKVREYLSYIPETGLFFWGKASGRRAKVGAVAGGITDDGYIGIYLGRNRHSAHRLAWLYMHGEWPAGQIDHINRVRTDNRIANLRVVSRAENSQNTIRSSSKHGVPGVNQRAPHIWQAQITLNGKRISLGFFPTKEDASAAYLKAKQKMHPVYTHLDDARGQADAERLRMEELIRGPRAEGDR